MTAQFPLLSAALEKQAMLRDLRLRERALTKLAMPKTLSDWISAAGAPPKLPGRQSTLAPAPKPAAHPPLLGSDTAAGAGMKMTGPGAGFAAGVPVVDQGPQTTLPPQPTPAAPEFDFEGAFRKYHGTAYDPASSMDQGKMRQMRDLFQQHGKLSPSLVYGLQYGKQAAERLKVTHPYLGALLEKAARADSDAYISPGRAGLAGAIAPALAGAYAGTKVEDTPHGIVHGLGTGAGMLAGGLGGGALAALLSDPGAPGLMETFTGDHLQKLRLHQLATAGGAGLGGMAGGGLASALMANYSNKQRGAQKPKKGPIDKKDTTGEGAPKGKEESTEKAASLSSPSRMAHYALLAADLDAFEKAASGEGIGALLGALLGGGAGYVGHATQAGRDMAGSIGGKLGELAAPVVNEFTPRPGMSADPKGFLTDAANDLYRPMHYKAVGRALGEDPSFGRGAATAAGAGLGAMAGGAVGSLLGGKKKKPKEVDETDPEEEESLARPSKMAHYALLAAELDLVEKHAAASQISSRRTQTPKPVQTPVDFRHSLRHVGQKVTEDAGRGLNPLNREATDVLRDALHFVSSDPSGGDDVSQWARSLGLSSTPWETLMNKLRGVKNPYDRVFTHQMDTAMPVLKQPSSERLALKDQMYGYMSGMEPDLKPKVLAYEGQHGSLFPR